MGFWPSYVRKIVKTSIFFASTPVWELLVGFLRGILLTSLKPRPPGISMVKDIPELPGNPLSEAVLIFSAPRFEKTVKANNRPITLGLVL